MLKPSTAGADALPPAHVAIIMDGNGRWAQRRGLPRLAGHRKGAEMVREIVEAASEMGISCLTLFAFSTENWRRTTEEVRGLMNLFRIFIRREGRELLRRNVRVRFIGDRGALDRDLAALMHELEAATAVNTGLRLTVALNYGGRTEIVAATRHLAREVAAGRIDAEDIDERAFNAALWTDGLPDPDLVIRTSGEMRVSNFLTWQTAYSEFAFVDECWPEFTPQVFARALDTYGARERRFGAVPA
jgi:undecaprenyl diphosphate synthase